MVTIKSNIGNNHQEITELQYKDFTAKYGYCGFGWFLIEWGRIIKVFNGKEWHYITI